MSTPRKSAVAPARGRPPVVVTFDQDGEVLDVVGDIDWFVAGDDTRQDIYQRLQDLRAGGEGAPDIVPAMQLSHGRYADVHIVAEEDSRHFVLLDATELMQVVRGNQQASNETALLEDAQRDQIDKGAPGASPRLRPSRQFRRSSELFAELVHGARGPMAQLSGHARLLLQRCKNDPAALRSIAAIQHAAVRLDALSTNGLISLGELSIGAGNLGIVDTSQLAALLQETFALQAQAQGLGFEVRVPEHTSPIQIDTLALRQILINLVIHALEGIHQAGRLVVSLSVAAQGLEIEIAGEPSGFDAGLFGPLITTTELLNSDASGSLGLAVSQLLLRQTRATVELVPRRGGGHELWIRLPLDHVAGSESGLRVREFLFPPALRGGEKVAVVAVEPAQCACSVVELLVDLGVPVVSVQEVGRIETLLRDDALGTLVLSSPFEGRNGREILERLALPMESGIMLLTSADEIPGRSGWLRDRNRVHVATDADRDTLHAALRTVLAG